ncbi:2,4-dienoyl-CoA reductase (NADPH2) [Desulfatibacillum alkenivorans DSM 16219]|jgi:2,4-dienoyl-CoA reductase (NADPH2)|uniref:2,4-dienoyl-CoA reductase (NADPH2) n=1 Tax=Desulfatibacillum alkenivorans DSM 16219 TaxID=1121393 RepID=A0A1M6NZX3_9BACT|nr:NAD(P)/FAD-dependent oxidoreductase [Desulfatibacillum alkenivorans]SHK01193.1 2,4-dienoyl-CoA reductase (NADPH2) [Desulfatibacillum alkenivorans DSM 16219]
MEHVKLFEPFTIKGLQISNRTMMPAMGLLYTTDYNMNSRLKEFYLERARGGIGLMTIGPLGFEKAGSAPFIVGLFDDANVPALRELNDQIHAETDTKTVGQLLHQGRYAHSMLTGLPPLAPSALASAITREVPKEMTIDDIKNTIQLYADAAKRVKDAHYDVVEILACTGYLINQFLSPVTNHRKDEYGGSFENRTRFGREVIEAVRKAVGDDYIVGLRISGNDFMPGGHTNEESSDFAVIAEKAGVDYVNVTGGWHETNIPQLTSNVPSGAYVYLARGVKEKVNVPVIASNRMGDPDVAEKALRSGACDMICWGRPMLADPELPNKVKEGRDWEIIPCIACNQGCFDILFGGQPVRCIMNPRCGMEEHLVETPTDKPKKILVGGGGVAGMQFALTAAKRGHDVTLYEKQDHLGGQLILAMAPTGKEEFGRILTSLIERMDHYGVKVVLNAELTPEKIREEKPDVLAVASGALPITIPVPGADKPHVIQAWDYLLGKTPHIGKNVVVVGGSATGCETAHTIACMDVPDEATLAFLTYHQAETPEYLTGLSRKSLRNITIIDVLDRMAANVGRTSKWSLMKSLKLSDVTLKPQTKLVEIKDDCVVVETPDGTETIPADTVVMAVGAAPVQTLYDEFKSDGMEVLLLGDAKAVRNLGDAVREGYEAALEV